MEQNTSSNIFYSYIDIWTEVDKEPIKILLFGKVDYKLNKLKWGVAKW